MIKKVSILFAALFLSFQLLHAAKIPENAIGARLGWGVELSYQRALWGMNRLEADLGFFKDGFQISPTYQWVFDLSALSKGFNFYVGPGASLAFWGHGVGIGVSGQVGLDYYIPKSPIQLSLDFRPTFYLTPGTHFDAATVGFGVRYCFGQ